MTPTPVCRPPAVALWRLLTEGTEANSPQSLPGRPAVIPAASAYGTPGVSVLPSWSPTRPVGHRPDVPEPERCTTLTLVRRPRRRGTPQVSSRCRMSSQSARPAFPAPSWPRSCGGFPQRALRVLRSQCASALPSSNPARPRGHRLGIPGPEHRMNSDPRPPPRRLRHASGPSPGAAPSQGSEAAFSAASGSSSRRIPCSTLPYGVPGAGASCLPPNPAAPTLPPPWNSGTGAPDDSAPCPPPRPLCRASGPRPGAALLAEGTEASSSHPLLGRLALVSRSALRVRRSRCASALPSSNPARPGGRRPDVPRPEHRMTPTPALPPPAVARPRSQPDTTIRYRTTR